MLKEDTTIRLCKCCGDRDTLNVFGRCAACELRYQKDVLLETVVAARASRLDGHSMRLIMREFELRADELLARGRV